MTPEDTNQVKELIRQELSTFIFSDKFAFSRDLEIGNGRNIITGNSYGTKIATEGGATGQKLGFWGKVPVVQPATISDASSSSNIAGTDTVNRTQVQDGLDSHKTAINAIIDFLQSIGLMR